MLIRKRSFLANVSAARGYLVVSIQHDLETDDPMVTQVGEEYVGRRMQYNRGIFNIMFAIDELKKLYPNADYRRLTLVGHSNGGDISMNFAKRHPELVKKVVTLDNLRVPFITDGKIKILSFRSKDPKFKPDPGVVPDDEACEKAGIRVVRTEFQHNELSDRDSDMDALRGAPLRSPQFLRCRAAWSRDRLPAGSRGVFWRNRLILSAGWPRFLRQTSRDTAALWGPTRSKPSRP